MQDDAEDLTIEFVEPTPQPWRCGFNPHAAGYRNAAGRRRVLGIACSAAVALISGGLCLAGQLPSLPALLGVSVPVAVAAGMEWIWRRSRFCSLCGARVKSPFSASRLVWCPACYNLTNPEKIISGPLGVLDLTGDYLIHKDPILQFLACTSLLAVKDGAQQISFEPEKGAYEVRIRIGDKVYELVPPPSWLHLPVAQTVKAIAGLNLAIFDQRQECRIEVIDAAQRINTDVAIEPTEFGQKVVLRFLNNRSIELSRAAGAKLAEMEAKFRAEIANRPKDLRLPGKGGRFRAQRDVEVDVAAHIRDPGTSEAYFPSKICQCVLPKGVVIRLDYEPDPSQSTHCNLLPERYEELEEHFVESEWREHEKYSSYSLSLSYVELDRSFEWLQKDD